MFDAQTDAFFQGRCRQVLSGAQVVSGLTEDPGVGEGAAADHDTVAADGEHPLRVFRGDDVAVTNDGDRDHFFDLLQPMPIRLAGVGLAARAAVDGDRFGAGLLDHARNVFDHDTAGVPPQTGFHGDRELGRFNGCLHDFFKAREIFQERGPVSVRDMVLDPATAVDVDEIRPETLGPARGLGHGILDAAKKLNGDRAFLFNDLDLVQGLGDPADNGLAAGKFRVDDVRAQALAEDPAGRVRHVLHGRQDNGFVDVNCPYLHQRKLYTTSRQL